MQAALDIGGKRGALARRLALLCFLVAGVLLLVSLLTTPPSRAGQLPDPATTPFTALRG